MEKLTLIALAMVGMTAFLNLLRFAQYRGVNLFALAAFNYTTAAATFIIWAIVAGVPVTAPVLGRGIAIGALYGSSFFLILYGMRTIGVAKTSTIVNLAQAIPVLASIFIWAERPGIVAIVGIIGSAIAIPLILLPAGSQRSTVTKQIVIGMLLLFVAQGLAYTIMKSFERLHLPDHRPVLLAGLFGTAAMLTTMLMIIKRVDFSLREVQHGLQVGVCNVISNMSLVAALATAAASIVFPTVTAGTIVLTTFASMVLWKERYSPRAIVGLCIAIISVVLINL